METRAHISHGSYHLAPLSSRLLLIGVLTGLLGAASAASAATYYLNTTDGSDANPGTIDRPWQSLTQVQAGAKPGDTIVIQSADASTYAARWPAGLSYRATTLQQFSIAWTFDTDYPVGQFATGDFWVMGPVKIIGIDPPSQSINGRVINGSMLNPTAGSYLPQGYDSVMPSNPYDPALNVSLGVSAAHPLVVTTPSSLISSISIPTPGSIPQLEQAAILTVLTAPAAPGSFRPPYCGDRTVKFNKSALDYSLLLKLPPVAGTPSLASVEAQFAAPWIEHAGGWVATALRPKSNMPNYGREMHTAIGVASLMLHLNFPDAQKERLLVQFVQLGIDLYAVATSGGASNWVGEGGQAGGRKWPILFAGLMLHNEAMKAVGAKSGDYLYQNGYPGNIPPDYIHFGEDDQTFYVAQVDVDATHSPAWKPDSRDSQLIAYEASDIGLPEWGIDHSRTPQASNKWWPTIYRMVAGPPFHGTALAALLTEGGKAVWNHNSYFDYTDRYMAMTATTGEYPGWRSMNGFTETMWDTYRAQCGPIWPMTGSAGPVLAPIGDQQITTGQTLTLEIRGTGPNTADLIYSATGLPQGATFVGQTFTWTPTAAQAGVYQVTFTLDDGKYRDSKTITITVFKENSAPVLGTLGSQSIQEDQVLALTLSATDADGDALTYSAGNLPTGATLVGPTFRWTPSYSQAGSYNVVFTVSDGQAQDSKTLAITVANIDRPPVLADLGSQSATSGNPLGFALSATDPDGDSLTYSADGLPSGATLTGQAFAWTPTTDQAGSYAITFTVSDGTLIDSQTVAITVAGRAEPPQELDRLAPVVAGCSPAPDAIQVPLNNLVTFHVTDSGRGVDPNSIMVQVNDHVVYQGNTDAYASEYGRCSRSGTVNDYRFIYQAPTAFDFDQAVAVSITAADLAGNPMSEYRYSFTTEMLAFGKNLSVSTLGQSADAQAVTACDPAGNIWVAWHGGAVNRRDIYVARRPAGSSAFQTPLRLTSNSRDQCNPALAVSAAGVVYVVWQDNRSGNWDIYASSCSNGTTFSTEKRVTSFARNEINPAVAVDHQTPTCVYVAWQDDRSGNQDVYVAKSTNGFATSVIAQVTNNLADQREPTVALDTSNTAYVFWTDLRNGPADIYGAASSSPAGAWINVPVVTETGAQTQPAVAAASDTLHLVWADNRSGNSDIYYAALQGLPGSPVSGLNVIDDTSGAEQTAPAVICSANAASANALEPKVFVCWQDARHTGATDTDTDLYLAEVQSGAARANIFVGDDRTNVNQSEPALGLSRDGQPYVVWTDWRQRTTEIYYAAATHVDPTPLDAKTVVAVAGATVGTDPAAIRTTQDVSLVVPAGACQADLRMSISRILEPQVSDTVLLGSYEFGPSGADFGQPVTVTIPYTASGNSRPLPYWYDSVTGALSQQGITDVENISISTGLGALRFRTTHFTPFYLIEAGAGDTLPVSGGSGGGCSVSPTGDGSPWQLLMPYAAIAILMAILRHRDRKRACPAVDNISRE